MRSPRPRPRDLVVDRNEAGGGATPHPGPLDPPPDPKRPIGSGQPTHRHVPRICSSPPREEAQAGHDPGYGVGMTSFWPIRNARGSVTSGLAALSAFKVMPCVAAILMSVSPLRTT